MKRKRNPRFGRGNPQSAIRNPQSRRGVLLLVVLSVLVLFMLIGTAFLMSSGSSRDSAKAAAKKDRLGNHATRLLDRALLQVLRDTDDPHSAVRYHSLLRDLYGTDGFQAVVYSPLDDDFDPDFTTADGQATRFAGASATTGPLGRTQGQFVDIYVRGLAFSANDPMTNVDEVATVVAPDLRHIVKLDRDVLGQPRLHNAPLTRGYYNGCLLTMTSGPAAGQSTRIVDFEHVADIDPTLNNPTRNTRLFRFRVLAFPRADGRPLQISSTRSPEIADLAGETLIINGRAFSGTGVGFNPLADPGRARLTALHTFRPAQPGDVYYGAELALLPNTAYMTAEDFANVYSFQDPLRDPFLHGNRADTNRVAPGLPNSFYAAINNPTTPVANRPALWKYQTYSGPGDANEGYDAPDFQNMGLAWQSVTPRAQGRVVHSNSPLPFEVDFQIGLQNQDAFTNAQEFLRLDLEDLPLPSFHRPDLEHYWFHRLLNSDWLRLAIGNDDDRVKAILQPYNQNGQLESWVPSAAVAAQITAIKRRISLRPLREDHPNFDGSNPQSRVMSSVDLANISDITLPLPPLPPPRGERQIAIPFWEAMGPWDVDNDNDGVADSNWVDLGDAIQEAEDGTRYKPLYAFLIMDLDGRLNVNAHGVADHINPPDYRDPLNPPRTLSLGRLDHTGAVGTAPNLAGTDGLNKFYFSDILAQGTGYGPADISLRPVFPIPWQDTTGTLDRSASRSEAALGVGTPIDSYATLFVGRERIDGVGVPGKYGFAYTTLPNPRAITPGLNYQFRQNLGRPAGEQADPDLAAQLKFFDYPWAHNRFFGLNGSLPYVPPSGFGTPSDLFGRYALGLDYAGQPVVEHAGDRNNWSTNLPHALFTDAPYELNVSSPQRRDTWGPNFAAPIDGFNASLLYSDDAAFAATDLERVLRSYDADQGTLPSRLWDVVDAFDPVKLAQFDPFRVTGVAQAVFGSSNPPERLAAAQQIAAINRRLVTTDSFDLPVPNMNLPNMAVLARGADGAPGRLAVQSNNNGDDDNDGVKDDADEVNSPISDDFRSLFGKDVSQATIFDLLRYRVWVAVRQRVMIEQGLTEATLANLNTNPDYANFLTTVSLRAEAALNGEPFVDGNGNGLYDGGETYTETNGNNQYDGPLAQLLAPELVAGLRMDLNRPFGDGHDNGDGVDNDSDGAMDEPGEDFGDGIDNDLDGAIDEADENPVPDGVVDKLGEALDPLMNGIVDEPMEAGEPFLDVWNSNGATPQPPDGKYQAGEPFLDLDGSGDYTGPVDQLWRDLTLSGTLGERVTVDYTNGQGVPLHAAVANKPGPPPIPVYANVRNLESQARQLYARQLYCLMLMLVDENYIAPYDEFDPQTRYFLDTSPEGSRMAHNVRAALGPIPDPNPVVNNFDQRARQILLRKLTCRMIAQWAVNCVDMRDPDAVMTPFEYDEYPWDGWGVPDRTGVTNIPLDGDPATNENGSMVLYEVPPASITERLSTHNMAEVIDWDAVFAAGATKVISNALVPGPATSLNQTRGLVWGAERPELLITETLAFHDRRTEDLNSDLTRQTVNQFNATPPNLDPDLDQRLRPRGSLFVELYNPWSQEGQLPAEFYSKLTRPTVATAVPQAVGVVESTGLELGRLSTFGIDKNTGALSNMIEARINRAPLVKRSPVWRIAVVEESPWYRNDNEDGSWDTVDNGEDPNGTHVHTDEPNEQHYVRGRFRPADPDLFPPEKSVIENGDDPLVQRDNQPYVERALYFTSDSAHRFERFKSPGSDPGLVRDPGDPMMAGSNGLFLMPNQQDDNQDAMHNNKVDNKLRLPPQVVFNHPTFGPLPRCARYFVAADVTTNPDVAETGDIPDLTLAPIRPGRYAIVGSAGAQYFRSNIDDGVETFDRPDEFAEGRDVNGNLQQVEVPRFVTTISRRFSGLEGGTEGDVALDRDNRRRLYETRRIELRPHWSSDVQQFMVASNGGVPLFPVPGPNPDPITGLNPVQRDNEVVKLTNGTFRNVYDSNGDPTSDPYEAMPDPGLIPPCVAIPVMNMSVSEPLDVYVSRCKQIYEIEKQIEEQNRSTGANITLRSHYWNPEAAYGEGAYVFEDNNADEPGTYYWPFDVAPELVRSGTTVNYRTIHLQRLADPTLPWNPLPTLADGTPNPDYDPKLPVNLYRTIDSSSVDLTAYNGASSKEYTQSVAESRNHQNYYLAAFGVAPDKVPQPRTTVDQVGEFNQNFGQPGRATQYKHRMSFKTLERGSHDRDWLKEGASPAESQWISQHFALAPRSLWRQEPVNRFLDEPPADPRANPPVLRDNDMLEWNEGLDGEVELRDRVNDMRARDGYLVYNDLTDANSLDNAFPVDPANFPIGLRAPILEPVNSNRGNGQNFDILLDHSLGFQNEAFGALVTDGGPGIAGDWSNLNLPRGAVANPLRDSEFSRSAPVPVPPAPANPKIPVDSTYPWLAWINRPYISGPELLQVPGASSAQMLRHYSTISGQSPNPYDGTGIATIPPNPPAPVSLAVRLGSQLSPFGHLLNMFLTASFPARVAVDATGAPILDANMNWQNIGAPHYYRILDFVHVPSRYVGTDELLNAEIYNDNPFVSTLDENVAGQIDPRYYFQPPFNKVSRQREPGKVNLNTVTSRRIPGSWNGDLSNWDPDNSPRTETPPRVFSEVYDGIMQRDRDGVASGRLSHLGPAWRDVVISRKGYAQFNADGTGPVEKFGLPTDRHFPDVYEFGLNANFPTVFANPFRSSDAGDLVPLQGMYQNGIQASWLRSHPFGPGQDGRWGLARQTPDVPESDDDVRPSLNLFDPLRTVDDQREAGYWDDVLVPSDQSFIPLFSERTDAAFVDGDRNAYLYYQPMTRLGNLVTNRSNVYAIWITVGYFELEKAPDWNDPNPTAKEAIRARFGGTASDTDPATIAAQALYNRVYPDGYMLGKEVGSDTGDTRRQRGFYIIDRSEPVGFKPGEDLNVERMIRLRRRIE